VRKAKTKGAKSRGDEEGKEPPLPRLLHTGAQALTLKFRNYMHHKQGANLYEGGRLSNAHTS
jgi:hypothetical protein